MAQKGPKKGKKGLLKVQNYHETVKKGPNFAFRSRQIIFLQHDKTCFTFLADVKIVQNRK